MGTDTWKFHYLYLWCKGKAEYAVLLGSGIVLIYVCQNSSDVIMIKYFKHFTQILYGRIQDMNITSMLPLLWEPYGLFEPALI